MAAAGVPMRTLQEWMGHRDIQTTHALRRLRAERARGGVRRGRIRTGDNASHRLAGSVMALRHALEGSGRGAGLFQEVVEHLVE